MSLRSALKSGVAAVCIAGLAVPPGAVAQARIQEARSPLNVRVGQARDFTRIEFEGVRPAIRREGQVLVAVFPAIADPDLSLLRVTPPRWIKATESSRAGGRLVVRITLADDADATVGAADGATFINAFAKASPPPPQAASAPVAAPAPSPEPTRPNPIPAGGVVPMSTTLAKGQVQLTFRWANPAGAAVFRRGGAVWVVFDAPARIDVSRAPRGLRQFTAMNAYRGADYSAVRIESPPDVGVSAASDGATWTVTLGAGTQPAGGVRIGRTEEGRDGITAILAGATRVMDVPDPVVGDRLRVVSALGPSKGLARDRRYVQLSLLSSAQGLAIAPRTDDLDVSFSGDIVTIGRSAGLALSPRSAIVERALSEPGTPQAAPRPGQIDPENWARTGEGGFRARYDALMAAAAAEAAKGKDAPVAARMALARFLVGSELSYEAIGVLNALAKQSPTAANLAEFRGLRGVARVMARRYQEAGLDFSVPVLSDDPASALWRAVIAARTNQWAETRRQFAAGAEAFSAMPAVWRARMARADAEAALNLGDLAGAQARIKTALEAKAPVREELETRLLQARVLEAAGQTAHALHIYKAVSRSSADYLQAPALLRATELEYQAGKITPQKAAAVYDALRFRWRGDATELETSRALGRLYLSQGRYREALEALRTARFRGLDLPQAADIQNDLSEAFRGLFLDGLADGLQPIQALAMFYDFKDLTPPGADGDMMVRRLVRRLVDVDLLPQAAELLDYQVQNRLDGIAKAQVATDLALIYLMDRQPEKALQAINGSRTTVLPAALNAERRLIEARALLGLGRADHALEVLGRNVSPEANALRAEASWRQKDWPAAGNLFERALGDRWKRPETLSADEEATLLRAGVSYSLAGDEAALSRLDQRYRGFYDTARNPEALRVALTGVSTGRLSISDFGSSVAENEAFAGWVNKMKARFREKATAPAGAPSLASSQPPAAPARG